MRAGRAFRLTESGAMKLFQLLARAVFSVISLALMILAGGLIVYAGMQLWEVFGAPESDIGSSLLDAVGYTVIAIAVFEVAKYILEEEVLDPTEMRHTGEARRSMTKFISTIAIAVFLEALVTVFEASKQREMEQMLYPTLLLFGGIALVVGLGVYQRLSVSAERESEDPPEEQKDPDLP
jgi:Ca2+/Na+ antiporter